MRILLIALAVLAGISSCSNRKVPSDVLEPEKMKEVLWDMLRAGEMLNGYILYRDTMINPVMESQRWYAKVYELHGITKEQFIRSYNFYRENPDFAKPIFDEITKYEESKPGSGTTAPIDTTVQTPDTAASATIKPPASEFDLDSLKRIKTRMDTNRRRSLELKKSLKEQQKSRPPVQ